jgi:hypothetical protein
MRTFLFSPIVPNVLPTHPPLLHHHIWQVTQIMRPLNVRFSLISWYFLHLTSIYLFYSVYVLSLLWTINIPPIHPCVVYGSFLNSRQHDRRYWNDSSRFEIVLNLFWLLDSEGYSCSQIYETCLIFFKDSPGIGLFMLWTCPALLWHLSLHILLHYPCSDD